MGVTLQNKRQISMFMKSKFQYCVVLALALAVTPGLAGSPPKAMLMGWGIEEKHLDEFMANAEAVGFDALITEAADPVFLKAAVAAGAKHRIKIFACLSPMSRAGRLWEKRNPGRPIPWQVMSDDENVARNFIMAGTNQYLIPYQFGGEPKMKNEVLIQKIICLNNPDARDLFKSVIDEIVSVPGIEGIAFDGFGYQNFHRCYCDLCQKHLAGFRAKHPEMSQEESAVSFSRETLVESINTLADYARSKGQNIKTSIHIWPVFSPDPLYGNRLDIDYCGQTAAWVTLWPEGKIAAYSRVISGKAKTYHQRQIGLGMIGYYDLPGKFPVKDANRVDLELRTMFEAGCRSIQVGDARDVLKNKEIAAVFKKYFH
jgi:hypothetical protein